MAVPEFSWGERMKRRTKLQRIVSRFDKRVEKAYSGFSEEIAVRDFLERVRFFSDDEGMDIKALPIFKREGWGV